jgi:hypothetical protein
LSVTEWRERLGGTVEAACSIFEFGGAHPDVGASHPA